MAAFTAKDVQALREKTGCGMMDCKKALTQAEGDTEKAVELLREKGLSAAAKKADRIAADGIVVAYIDEAKKAGAVVEVNSETDFVAKNARFVAFADAVAKTVVECDPADLDALLKTVISGGKETVEEALRELILVIGENLKVRRFQRMEGTLVSYIHAGGKIGVMVQFEADGLEGKPEFQSYAHDIAMQIAAVSPAYLCSSRVPDSILDEEKKVLLAQIANDPKLSGKPDAVKQKMVDGKLGKYYKENCLLNQEFVKDPEMDIETYTNNTAKALGGVIKILDYVRFEKGEGLEKREENFADEIAGLIK